MDKRILAVDIGTSAVKVAEFSADKSGGIQLTRFGVQPLGAEHVSESDRAPLVTHALKELLAQSGITPGPAVVTVAGQSVFSRFVRLPPVDKGKVQQMIRYEAQQNVPFPIEEVVWDYQLIGTGAEGELDVMLAAAKADLMLSITESVQEAGFTVTVVDVSPVSLYNAVRFNYPDREGCTLVIDMGARSTDLTFMDGNRVFMRSVPVAGQAITQQIMREFELSFEDAEEMKRAHAFVSLGGAYEAPPSEVEDKVSKIVRSVMTRMHAEITRSINFFRSQQGGRQPSLILLTGGCAVIPNTDSFFREKLEADVEYLNPFANVPVAATIDAEVIGQHAHLLGQAVGLALREAMECPIEINLLPPQVAAERALIRKQPALVGAMALVVVAIVMWAAYFIQMEKRVSGKSAAVIDRVAQLERLERPLKDAEAQRAASQERLDRYLQLGERRGEWARLLSAVQAAIPAELWLASFKPLRAAADPNNPGGPAPDGTPLGSFTTLELTGFGFIDPSVEDPVQRVIAFRDNLRKDDRFDPAQGKTDLTRSPPPEKEDSALEFSITAVLKNPVSP